MEIHLYSIISFLCLQKLLILRCRCVIERSKFYTSMCLCESELSLEWHFSFVLVLTLKVWRALWRARWTNQSPGVGPLRTCTEEATCLPPWATVYPAREDILPCGECLDSGTGGFVGYVGTTSVEDPGLCVYHLFLSHDTCVVNDSKCRFLREFMGSSVGQYSMPLSSLLQILLLHSAQKKILLPNDTAEQSP